MVSNQIHINFEHNLLNERNECKSFGYLPVAVPKAVCPITTSGAENSRFDDGEIVLRLIAENASPKSINFKCGFCSDSTAADDDLYVMASIFDVWHTKIFSGLMSKWATFR